MPYDPPTDSVHRLQSELHKLRMELIDERSKRQVDVIKLQGALQIGAIVIFFALLWLGIAIYRVNERVGMG